MSTICLCIYTKRVFALNYIVNDSVRVKVPSRYNEIQPNAKYVAYIHQIVIGKLKERHSVINQVIQEFKDEDISTTSVRENQNLLNNILTDLAYNIFLKEHRLRYQTEQKVRFEHSLKQFTSFSYLNRGKTVEQFIVDYNDFLWKNISSSHLGLSPKIENNYRRNYHDGEVSPVTSLIFFLYFKTGSWSRYLARVLAASYRNPSVDFQKKYI